MHVINAGGAPRRSERQLREMCRDVPGILVLNAIVEGEADRTREIDGVALTPTGLFAIEVKGTQLSGAVRTDTNRPWTIGGTPADFYGSANPMRQARTAAQSLAAALRSAGLEAGFVTPVVAVSGNRLHLDPHRLGDTWVTQIRDIAAVLGNGTARPVTTATAAALCGLLGVDLAGGVAEEQGFVVPGSRAARTRRNQQLRTTAADALHAAFEVLPGRLVVPGDGTGSGPDLSAVLVTPGGIFAVKSKATTLRGPVETAGKTWTIGGTEAYFGRGRPEEQARAMATWLTKAVAGRGTRIRVTPVVTLCGNVETNPHRSAGAWVCRSEDLAGVLLRAHHRVTVDEAEIVLEALGTPTTREQLRAEGFAEAPEAPVAPVVEARTRTRKERRAGRLAAAQRSALVDWRSKNRRRVAGSVGSAALLTSMTSHLSPAEYRSGLLVLLAAAAWQLVLRHGHTGLRTHGVRAAVSWLVSLLPVGGLGVLVAAAGDVASSGSRAQENVALLFFAMTAALFGAIILLGRSSFVYPPATVVETYDQHGRPTGTYTHVRARSRPWRRAAGHTAED